jgi:hypothetical protein
MDYLTEQREQIESSQNARIYNKCTYIMYMNHPKKNLKGNFVKSQGRMSESSPLRSEDSQDSQTKGQTS